MFNKGLLNEKKQKTNKKMIPGSCPFYCLTYVKIIVFITLLVRGQFRKQTIVDISNRGDLIQGIYIVTGVIEGESTARGF